MNIYIEARALIDGEPLNLWLKDVVNFCDFECAYTEILDMGEDTNNISYLLLKVRSAVSETSQIYSLFELLRKRFGEREHILDWFLSIESDTEISIPDDEIRVEFFTSTIFLETSMTTKVDRCVSVTHIPTGYVYRCQAHRSPIKNKQEAILVLISKLAVA
jgi:hypothetical protein